MDLVEKKLRRLEICTKPIPALSISSEGEDTEDDTLVSPSVTSLKQEWDTANSDMVLYKKRYSTSSLHQVTGERLVLDSEIDSKSHKRSCSTGSEIFLSRNQSVPDLVKRSSFDRKLSTIKHLGNTASKKKWFQMPRIKLKRQASTPPRKGLGGLKAGAVEPPEPPPLLLFNLDWSTSDTTESLLWDYDVSNHSISTPTPSGIQRRYSGYGLDIITSKQEPFSSPPSLSSTISTTDESTVANSDVKSIRRLSCPIYDSYFTDKVLSFTDEEEAHENNNSPTVIPERVSSKAQKCPICVRFFCKINNNSPLPESPKHSQSCLAKRLSNNDSIVLNRSSPTSVSTPSTSSSSSSSVNTPTSEDYKLLLCNAYLPGTQESVLSFNNIKPRSCKLKRRVNAKLEQKALHMWQSQLLTALNEPSSLFPKPINLSLEKKERHVLTRKFILREFYTTEINFWNQLNYTKIMFSDPLHLALERNSPLVKPADFDAFVNLSDLMKFSSILIVRLRKSQLENNSASDEIGHGQDFPSDVNIGLILREMAQYMVVFLRCAIDYKANRKLVDNKKHNKGYALYNEKLALRKETRQFTVYDYLIIPIQRITRFDLLLADLEKHTDPTHLDYNNIIIARCIIKSLATAMNYAQK